MTPARRVATRGSALARWQAQHVLALLASAGSRSGVENKCELLVVSTRGDQDKESAIHALGGTGVFVKEVQDAVRRGEADMAVHSAKDLPAETPEGLVLVAIPERGDPRDALVGCRLEDLPTTAHIGTGSVRRRAQLAGLRPDLTFGELRGNIPTRLGRAVDFDAIVVAAAALDRLDLADRISERLDPSFVLPQVGQGALAVECRADDTETLALLAEIDDADAHDEVRAERAFLAQLGGGCNLPCGALARRQADGSLVLDALLASLDGHIVLTVRGSGSDPDTLGREVARRLLHEEGGSTLLDAIGIDQLGAPDGSAATP